MLSSIISFGCAAEYKAIVSAMHLHGNDIHQHGVLSNPLCYEIMTPESVGVPQNDIVLGKHSGRHALVPATANLVMRSMPARSATLSQLLPWLTRRKIFTIRILALLLTAFRLLSLPDINSCYETCSSSRRQDRPEVAREAVRVLIAVGETFRFSVDISEHRRRCYDPRDWLAVSGRNS
jgi:hypothetical protein